MSEESSLYEEDVLLWSEQQAALLRALGRDRNDLPNALDIENVAEEIESVGLSELHSVESYLRLMLLHLLKIALEPDAHPVAHWREEILNWHADLQQRFTPSMRQRIDLDKAWRLAARQVSRAATLDREQEKRIPKSGPISRDVLLADDIDLEALILAMKAALVSEPTA